MKYIILLIVVTLSLSSNKNFTYQVKEDLVGEWEPISSTNKKYNLKDCFDKTDNNWNMIFYANDTYKRIIPAYPKSFNKGQFLYDISNKKLKLFKSKFYSNPDYGTESLDITYSIIYLDKTTLKLSECYCKGSEADEESSEKCITVYRKKTTTK